MSKAPFTIFPPLDSPYVEEFGFIDPVVYLAAQEQWAQAERLAIELLNDAHEGLRLMLKAVASVSRVRHKDPNSIKKLPAYLFFSYKRLLLAELEKENGHHARLAAHEAESGKGETDEEKLNRQILINEIRRQMDEWTREVFDLLCLGYKYEDLVPECGSAANVIRSKYHKKVEKLAQQVQERINKSLNLENRNLPKGAFVF